MIDVLQVNHLRDIGKRTLDEFFRKTMIKLMTNDAALQYNMNGRNYKTAFSNLILFDILYGKLRFLFFILIAVSNTSELMVILW